jgi:hypothetical protein
MASGLILILVDVVAADAPVEEERVMKRASWIRGLAAAAGLVLSLGTSGCASTAARDWMEEGSVDRVEVTFAPSRSEPGGRLRTPDRRTDAHVLDLAEGDTGSHDLRCAPPPRSALDELRGQGFASLVVRGYFTPNQAGELEGVAIARDEKGRTCVLLRREGRWTRHEATAVDFCPASQGRRFVHGVLGVPAFLGGVLVDGSLVLGCVAIAPVGIPILVILAATGAITIGC